MEELQMNPGTALAIFPIGCILVLFGYATGEIFNTLPLFGFELNILIISGCALIIISSVNLIQLRILKKQYENKERYR